MIAIDFAGTETLYLTKEMGEALAVKLAGMALDISFNTFEDSAAPTVKINHEGKEE
jgi:hypothetical protein